jgi:hypothetical protein
VVNLDLIEQMVKKGAKVVLFYPENRHDGALEPYLSYSAVILGPHSTDTTQLSTTAKIAEAAFKGQRDLARAQRESSINRLGQLVTQEIYGVTHN